MVRDAMRAALVASGLRLVAAINAIWPSASGDSRWRLRETAGGAEVFSPAPYARYVRRSGGRAPLVETEIPRLVDQERERTTRDLRQRLRDEVRAELAPHLPSQPLEVL